MKHISLTAEHRNKIVEMFLFYYESQEIRGANFAGKTLLISTIDINQRRNLEFINWFEVLVVHIAPKIRQQYPQIIEFEWSFIQAAKAHSDDPDSIHPVDYLYTIFNHARANN